MALDLVSALSFTSNWFCPCDIIPNIFLIMNSHILAEFSFFLDWKSQFLTPPLIQKAVHVFDHGSSLSPNFFKSSVLFLSETIKTECSVLPEVFLNPYEITVVFDHVYWTYCLACISDRHLFLFHNHTKQSSSSHSRHGILFC